jgi:nicotinamide-nucleotide amidase
MSALGHKRPSRPLMLTSALHSIADIWAAQGPAKAHTTADAPSGRRHRPRNFISRSLTGIAGPTGGSADKPVGLVHFAAASRGGALTHKEMRYGDIRRAQVRQKSVLEALAMLREMAEST